MERLTRFFFFPPPNVCIYIYKFFLLGRGKREPGKLTITFQENYNLFQDKILDITSFLCIHIYLHSNFLAAHKIRFSEKK